MFNSLQYSINITFGSTDKPKFCVTCIIGIFTLFSWSGTEYAVSMRYAFVKMAKKLKEITGSSSLKVNK